MARPNKQGVDYFPLDVHLDDKFKFIEIKYKLEGFAVLIKLLQRIYAHSYWCKWTEDELLLFSDEIKADHELVQNVVNECLKRDVFNQELYDKYNILTSKGIQKRYKEIVRRRKDVEVTEEYLLIDNNLGVNDDINASSSKRNDDKSTQSKGKESKQKVKQKKNGPKQVYDESSVFYQLANYFLEQIRNNNPEHKTPNMQNWSDDIRKMMELDKRSEDQIKYLMKWVQQDKFEMANVLSPSKLRERFDQLVIKVKNDKNATSVQRPKKSREQIEHEKLVAQMREGLKN